VSIAQRILVAIAVAVGGLVMLGLVAVAGLTWLFGDSGLGSSFETSTFANLGDWEAAAGFEQSLGLEFPPSTSNVRVATDGFQEPIYQIRFTIDDDDLPILESSIGCDGLLSQQASTPPRALIAEEVPWWQPDEASIYQECSGGQAPGRVLEVFVDRTSSSTSEVYLLVVFL
jgi:hypothetical protein